MPHEIIHYSEVDSTNNILKALAEDGAGDGLTVWADLQTAGKGRLGRRWSAEKGENATFSVLVRKDAEGLVFRAALAGARAVNKLTGANCLIKWPNDIVIGGKKVAGILCEAAFSDGLPEYMIMGMGINLNQEAFPEDLPNAGSVRTQTGMNVTPEEFIKCFLTEFDAVLDEKLSAVLNAIVPMSATVGNMVKAGEITGKATGFKDDGSLVIENEDGEHVIVVGDVSVRGLYGYVD